jgi:hypothetical protein
MVAKIGAAVSPSGCGTITAYVSFYPGFGGQNRVATIRIAVDLLFRDVTGKSIWKEKGHEE